MTPDEIRRSVFDALWKARPKDENGLPVALVSSLQVWPMVEAVLKATQVEELEAAAQEAADWLDSRPDMTEGDVATSTALRIALEKDPRRDTGDRP